MKKSLLLFTGVFISGYLLSQSGIIKSKIPSYLLTIAHEKTQIDETSPELFSKQFVRPNSELLKANKSSSVSQYNDTVIGSTYYDIESNGGPADRIVVNADSTIAAIWTMDLLDPHPSASNRGTGYNYFNGTSWGTHPTVRIENARVGWGNIVNTRSGNELVLSHNGGASKLHIASRATKGTGSWSNSTTAIANITGGNWWPRMVTSMPSGGDTIYAISISYPGTIVNGLDAALFFSRSTDAGLTWDIVNQQPTGLTSLNFLGFKSDNYAIAAKGSTVAIVAGNSDSDVGLAKSIDGGVTWTYKTIYQFPLPLWNYVTTTSDINNDAIADTISTTDANFAIAVDNNGTVFVAYGAYRLLNDVPSASGYKIFPFTDGLYLWNENMPQNLGGNIVAHMQDLGEQGTIYFPPQFISGTLPFGSWGSSLTSFPSMAFNSNNELYISYSSVVDSLMSALNPEKLVRHQYVIKACNLTPGSEIFTQPIDIVPASPGLEYEGLLGSMAKNINGSLHILYMRDYNPGINTYSIANPDGPNDPDYYLNPSEMVYVKISEDEFATTCITNIKDAAKSSSISNLNFYPNPASNNAIIDVKLTETAKLDVAILNSVGQTIYTTVVNGNVGSNKVDVNLNNLSAGLYFYQVKVGNIKAITKKFAIEK